MADINVCICTGKLGADIPQPTTTGNGNCYVKFSIASNDSYKKTTWIPCTAYGKVANYLSNYGKKGDAVEIQGTYSSYKKEDGTWVHGVNVLFASLLGKRSAKGSTEETGNAESYQNTVQSSRYEDDDDVPF